MRIKLRKKTVNVEKIPAKMSGITVSGNRIGSKRSNIVVFPKVNMKLV